MFYQCTKCKKIWQYPIEKCPDCFSRFAEMKSGKIKVIGVSRVLIPTILHPKVPYFVLVLEDADGNKWAQKSVKEYKIGEEFEIKSSDGKKSVVICRIKYNILEAVRSAVQSLGELELNADLKVLVLPTLVAPTHPYSRDNTSPEFLEAVLKFLIERKIKIENIKVAAQSFDEIPAGVSARKSQLLNICQKFKVLPLDLAETSFIKKEAGQLTFEIPEEVLNADLIINLPIFKIGRPSASENILKLLKKENYLGLKYLYSDKDIIENFISVLPRYLTIAEGETIQKRDKSTVFLGLVLGSFDSLNLDRVFFEIIMQKDLPEILKEITIDKIPILGRKIEEVALKP